jgi:hypothetical protein
MVIKKNPSWHVWVTELAYWIRHPPQIYFLIIIGLGAALFLVVTSNSPQTSNRPVATQYVPPIRYAPAPVTPPYVPPQQAPISPPTISHQAPTPSASATNPLKDRCSVDHIFVDSSGQCTPLISGHWYVLAQGNVIRFSQNMTMVVTMGSIRVTPAPPRETYSFIMTSVLGSNRTTVNGGMITALESYSRVGVQFPIP